MAWKQYKLYEDMRVFFGTLKPSEQKGIIDFVDANQHLWCKYGFYFFELETESRIIRAAGLNEYGIHADQVRNIFAEYGMRYTEAEPRRPPVPPVKKAAMPVIVPAAIRRKAPKRNNP